MHQNLDAILGTILLIVGSLVIALPFLFLQRLGVTSKNILAVAVALGAVLVLFGILCGEFAGSHYAAIPGGMAGTVLAVWVLIVAAVVAARAK